MATTVTAAHHSIWRHLYATMQAAQTPASGLRFVTTDKESRMSTLWQEEEFDQISSRESLTEKAAENGKTISVQEHERIRHDFDPIFLRKSFLESKAGWHSDSGENNRTIGRPKVN